MAGEFSNHHGKFHRESSQLRKFNNISQPREDREVDIPFGKADELCLWPGISVGAQGPKSIRSLIPFQAEGIFRACDKDAIAIIVDSDELGCGGTSIATSTAT